MEGKPMEDEMALYVTYGKHDPEEDVWYVGSPFKPLKGFGPTKVQADGHELEHIKRCFSNIPMHNGRVVSWTDVYAIFICENLGG